MDLSDLTLLEKLQLELLQAFYRNQKELCCPEVLCKSEQLDRLVVQIMRKGEPVS